MSKLTKDQVRQIIAKAPKGTSPEGIVAALRAQGHELEGYGPAPEQSASAGPAFTLLRGGFAPTPQANVDPTQGLGATAGGVAGDIAGEALGGPPGAIAGATILGTAGDMGERALRGQPFDFMASGKQGLAQGAGSVVGLGLGKILKLGAEPFMESALGPTSKMLKEQPTLIGDAVDAGATVGTLPGKAGSKAAKAKLLGLGADVDAKTAASGAVTNPGDLLTHVDKLIERTKYQPGGVAKRAALESLRDDFLNQFPNGLSSDELKIIKDEFGTEAQPVLKALKQGLLPGSQGVEAKFADAIRRGAKGELEKIPGLGAGEAAASKQIGVYRAVDRAESMRGAAPLPTFLPPAAGAVIPAMLRTRPIMSQAARMGGPEAQALARIIGRAGGYYGSQMLENAQ